MSTSFENATGPDDTPEPARRDFLYIVTGALGAVGAGAAMWPFIDSMNPTEDVLAQSSIEVDLTPIEVGQRITAVWQGKPIFIDYRTPAQIARAKADDHADLRDPALDSERAPREEWLIQIGICTHLGCIPLGQRPEDPRGDWGGWFCPCHGSHYDTAGRIRKGPAPKNLFLPPYKFLPNGAVFIG